MIAATITGISQQVKDTADNAQEAKTQSNTAGDVMETCNQEMYEMTAAMEETTRISDSAVSEAICVPRATDPIELSIRTIVIRKGCFL